MTSIRRDGRVHEKETVWWIASEICETALDRTHFHESAKNIQNTGSAPIKNLEELQLQIFFFPRNEKVVHLALLCIIARYFVKKLQLKTSKWADKDATAVNGTF